jgi:hypothetical protein
VLTTDDGELRAARRAHIVLEGVDEPEEAAAGVQWLS